ncbi:MAG: iron-containing alcohol dehydrogenase, partial [Chromatiales bacterium]|nr:iron-containing alcohol dehydrogenase [Chromatiales bacterium]
ALPADIEATAFDGIPPNPTVAGVEAAAEAYREHGCDGVLAVGGGSVMDSGKAVRVAVTHEGSILDYLRDPGRITADVAPLVTVPTTAGTGAELTMGGGIHPDATTRALGLRSAHIKPDLAICDPELALTLPPSLTAATGMDAFGHCLEAYLAKKDDPPGAAIALDGIRRVARHVERAYADGSDREARWHMQMAALQGGMAIYRGLGPVHALANTFGDADLHHGMLVTVSAPAVVRFYAGRLDSELADIAAAMGQRGKPDVARGIEELNARLGLPASLGEMGYDKSDLDDMSEDAAASHFNLAARAVPTREEYRQIIVDVLGPG